MPMLRRALMLHAATLTLNACHALDACRCFIAIDAIAFAAMPLRRAYRCRQLHIAEADSFRRHYARC